MASLSPHDTDYYRPSLLNLRGILANILFVNFLKRNNATPRYFKTAEDHEKFEDKNKEYNNVLLASCLIVLYLEFKSILSVMEATLISLLRKQLAALKLEKLRQYRKRIAQEAIEDTELEEQQRLQQELEILEILMRTPEYLGLTHSGFTNQIDIHSIPTKKEQQHFNSMQNSLLQTLTRHTAANQEYQTKMAGVEHSKSNLDYDEQFKKAALG